MGDHQPTAFGAHRVDDGVAFSVWSTHATTIQVVIDGVGGFPLTRDFDAIFSGTVPGIGPGARYRFRIDDTNLYPDPRSRFQPDGVHGASEVVDPDQFEWSDADWRGLKNDGLVIYELHVGTFTQAGTFRSAIDHLPALAALGVDAIELMPIADFPGRWNWGYDGVDLFAPSRAYGTPDDLRVLIDAAHALGLGVLLDVVYNHFGPDGNYLRAYSDDYFTHAHITPWGDAVNYDGPGNHQVREFIIENAIQWIREYHFDGLRLDAAEQIADTSELHVLAELQARVRASTKRSVVIFAEEARNMVEVVHPVEEGGLGLDGSWADDFHHSLLVFLIAIRDHYYADYQGTLDEVAKAINSGFVYQGEHSAFRDEVRGTIVMDEPASGFVFCLQNHDQIGNQPFGERLHHDIDRDRYATASALLLTLPNSVVLFMGQEFLASTPFLFFTDHTEELGKLVTEGRRREFAGLRAFGREELVDSIPDPQKEATYRASQIKSAERSAGKGMLQMYTDLLHLRKSDPVLSVNDRSRTRAEGYGAQVLVVRRWTDAGVRILIANFGASIEVPINELGAGSTAEILIGTSSLNYDGTGSETVLHEGMASVPARTAVLLAVNPAP